MHGLKDGSGSFITKFVSIRELTIFFKDVFINLLKFTLSVSTDPGFLLGIFSGGGAKSSVMQISFVMLLFSDQISERDKSFQGAPPLPRLVEESQELHIH